MENQRLDVPDASGLSEVPPGLANAQLIGVADASNDMAEQASPRYQHALPILEGLLQAEKTDREVRTLKYQLKSAKFPVYRDLVSFDSAQNPVDEALTRSLYCCDYLVDA